VHRVFILSAGYCSTQYIEAFEFMKRRSLEDAGFWGTVVVANFARETQCRNIVSASNVLVQPRHVKYISALIRTSHHLCQQPIWTVTHRSTTRFKKKSSKSRWTPQYQWSRIDGSLEESGGTSQLTTQYPCMYIVPFRVSDLSANRLHCVDCLTRAGSSDDNVNPASKWNITGPSDPGRDIASTVEEQTE
jgi:hypothetical protein